MAKKGYNYPIKKKIPLILLLNLFGTVIIAQFSRFVNIFSEIYPITFREVEKSPRCTACRNGGIVKAKFMKNNPSAAYGVSSLYTREPLNAIVHLQRGMGFARCICLTNAKLAIKTEERVIRKYNSVKLSLFCIFMSDILCFAKSDIALRAVILFGFASQ